MYNSVFPNIHYSVNRRNISSAGSNSKKSNSEQNIDNQATFPNGAKVAVDYFKGQINISQVIGDFKNTIIAINTPDDICSEVNLYLGLVEKESLKQNPSREIILSNLKNASRICDTYISESLKKPSKVVEGWIDALFLQSINLKADPNQINPDFLLDFPQKAQEKINNSKMSHNSEPIPSETITGANIEQSSADQPEKSEIKVEDFGQTQNTGMLDDNGQSIQIESEIETSESSDEALQDEFETVPDSYQELFKPLNESDNAAKELFIQAKQEPKNNLGDTNKLNLLNEALGILSNSESGNENIKAAIHFERGRVFDEYDYVDYALRDYNEATKTLDNNLKAQAYFKSGKIYDEFSEFNPALDNYLSCVAYCGQAENYAAQSLALTSIAGLYAGRFETDMTTEYNELALDAAFDTDNQNLIANIYSKAAQNYQYVGDDKKALSSYRSALEVFSRNDETYEQIAHNYEQASIVMERLGNIAKAKKLQAKADLYYQKAQLEQVQLEEAS